MFVLEVYLKVKTLEQRWEATSQYRALIIIDQAMQRKKTKKNKKGCLYYASKRKALGTERMHCV